MRSTILNGLRIGLAAAVLGVALVALGALPARADTGSNWQGFYWDNNNFQGSPRLSRIDPAINFNWDFGSPDPAIPPDNFSVRWVNNIAFAAGTYRFRAGADDGIRVAINGNLIINRFTNSEFREDFADVTLNAGTYQIIVDYFEGVGRAGVLFDWQLATSIVPTITPFGTQAVAVAPTTPPVIKAVVIVDRANIRSGPGLSYPTIGEAFLDDRFVVAGRNGDFGFETWFLLNLPGGGQGWMSRSVIYVYGGSVAAVPKTKQIVSAPAAPAVGVAPFEVQAVARNNALVRDAPTNRPGGSQRIGVIPLGATVKVLKLSINRAWVFIDYEGLQGWTYLPNLRIVVGSLSTLPRGN